MNLALKQIKESLRRKMKVIEISMINEAIAPISSVGSGKHFVLLLSGDLTLILHYLDSYLVEPDQTLSVYLRVLFAIKQKKSRNGCPKR